MKFRFEVDRGAEEFFEDYLRGKGFNESELGYEVLLRNHIKEIVFDILRPLVSDFDKDFLKGAYSDYNIGVSVPSEMEVLLICYMYAEFNLSQYFFELLLFFYSEKYGSVVRKYMRELLV